MEKFKGTYRIESTRLKTWDYGWNGHYFITICTANRTFFFGDVVNHKMDLSPIGHIANSCWHEIPKHFPFVKLGAHIIMPNHMHGIITINKTDDGRNNIDVRNNGHTPHVQTQNFASPQSQPPQQSQVQTQNFASQPQTPLPPTSKNQFGSQSKNLASIIRGYKIGVTKNARKINPDFAWQARFHDHIIRNQQAFENIDHYIRNNPSKWGEDKFNAEQAINAAKQKENEK